MRITKNKGVRFISCHMFIFVSRCLSLRYFSLFRKGFFLDTKHADIIKIFFFVIAEVKYSFYSHSHLHAKFTFFSKSVSVCQREPCELVVLSEGQITAHFRAIKSLKYPNTHCLGISQFSVTLLNTADTCIKTVNIICWVRSRKKDTFK